MAQSLKKIHILLIYLVLALATFIAYEPVRHNQFIKYYDDDEYVTENPQVQAGITRESVIWAFTTPHSANWHPLTWLSHMLYCQLFRLNPFWHHLTNLLFHIANTLLLFWVLKRMTGAVWPGAFVAAAFALHPLHVESVAWVAERKDLLSGFFWILTMAAYIRYAEHRSIGRYLLVFLLFGLGLMAKPMLVTLPFVLLLLDYWPLGRFQWAPQSSRQALPQFESAGGNGLSTLHLIVEKIPLFVLAAASSAVTFIIQQRWGAMKIANILPLYFRILNALVSYIRYIGKMIYPGRLAVMYLHPGYGLPIWQPVVALVILAGVTAGVIYTARRRPYLAVGWLWYLGILVPVIGLIQVGKQAMADRYTYLPSIGFFIMIAWGANELLAKWRLRKIVLAISAGLVLAALMIVTRMQVRYWRNNLTLYEHTLAVTGNNAVMHNDYGTVLLEAGQLDKAIKHFNEALRIYPQYLQARKNIAMAYIQQGKLDQAAEHFNEAQRIYPKYLQSHENIARMFLRQGKKAQAQECFNDLLRIKADWAAGYYKLGLAYARLRRYDLAVQNYKEALQLNPNFIEAINNLAVMLSNQGKIDEAIEKFEKALHLKPDDPFAHFNLGIIMVQQGKYDDAVKHYNETLQAKPDWPEAQNNLAWLLTVQARPDRRNAEKALTLAKRACELTNYKQPVYLRTLAAAYAATGQFPQAVSTAEQAIRLALSFRQKELAENIRNQLKLYRAERPYRLSRP